jgi:hypothetical protein
MEVVGFAVAEVVKPDLVNVGTVSGLCDVNCALFDELLKVFFVFSPRALRGGHRPWLNSRATFMAVVRVLSFFGKACMHAPH